MAKNVKRRPAPASPKVRRKLDAMPDRACLDPQRHDRGEGQRRQRRGRHPVGHAAWSSVGEWVHDLEAMRRPRATRLLTGPPD